MAGSGARIQWRFGRPVPPYVSSLRKLAPADRLKRQSAILARLAIPIFSTVQPFIVVAVSHHPRQRSREKFVRSARRRSGFDSRAQC